MVRFGVASPTRTILALIIATGLCACGPSGHEASPKSTSTQPAVGKSAADADRPTGLNNTPGKPVAPAFPPARPNLNPSAAPDDRSMSDRFMTKAGDSVEAVLDIAAPGTAQRTLQTGLAEVRKVNEQYRNLNSDQLKPALAANSPNAEAISTILNGRSDNEVIKLLRRYLTETNRDRAASNATLLLSEIFVDPSYAASKLAEISFDLGEVARRGYYDQAIAGRVALLQARLDESIRADHRAGLAKTALFIVGTAATSGFIAGREFRVLDKATGSLRSVKWAELMKTPSFEKMAARSVTNLERIAERAAAKLPQASLDVARSELGVLKFSETEINRLGLRPATKEDLKFLKGTDQPADAKKLKWWPTNRDRLQYAFSKFYNGPLTNERVIFFRIRRPLAPDAILIGKTMPNAEAKTMYDQLKRNPQVEYLNMVDGDAGVAQSAIRADTREEFAGQATRKPFAEKLGPTPETPQYAPAAPLPQVKSANFDWVRAAITATTIGSLTSGASVLAYSYGDRGGRDEENTYLERQVDRNARPPQTVVSDLNNK